MDAAGDRTCISTAPESAQLAVIVTGTPDSQDPVEMS